MQTVRTLTALSLVLPLSLMACEEAPEPNRDNAVARVQVTTTVTTDDRVLIDAVTYEPVEPAERYEALRVSITDIEVHGPDGWEVLATDVGWVSLVESEQAMDETVADVYLPEGEYDEIRLIVADAELDINGVVEPVTVPSGAQTGIKIKDSFCLDEDNGVSGLSVHWNLIGNLHITGNGELMLQPTVTLEDEPETCDIDNDGEDETVDS